MDTKPPKDSGVENVLQGAMRAALESGMESSRLLAIVMGGNTFFPSVGTPFNFNIVAGSDAVSVLKSAMKCALGRGTKPDELINIAVEVAFKNRSSTLEIVPTGQPALVCNSIKHEPMPDKPVSSAVEGNTIFTPATTPFNFNTVAVVNQTSLLKRTVSTEDLSYLSPRKRTQTTATKDRQKHKHGLTGCFDGNSLSDVNDSPLELRTLPGIRIIRLVDTRPELKPRSQTEIRKQDEEFHNLEVGRAFQRRGT
ncbi:hypothetical protein V502_11204 [Pseudogymnoascus sp. VKM F-4520 (FW-2644)]|nr:hypothetical protein V502_11204 [Pseudogymnoascus sp. VKM F-4520 (FW-2644)]